MEMSNSGKPYAVTKHKTLAAEGPGERLHDFVLFAREHGTNRGYLHYGISSPYLPSS